MIIDYLLYCRSVTLLIISPFPRPLTLPATKEGLERSTPALGVTGLPLFQEDKSWVSAISCQLLPILLWGHLFLLLAVVCLINPVHSPHLLQRLLTASLHLLAGICCPYWIPGQQCLQQMFYPWCAQSGATLCPSLSPLHTCSCFFSSSSCLVSLQGSIPEINLYQEDFTDVLILDERSLLQYSVGSPYFSLYCTS